MCLGGGEKATWHELSLLRKVVLVSIKRSHPRCLGCIRVWWCLVSVPQRAIQQSESGHDPTEDAAAAMELVYPAPITYALEYHCVEGSGRHRTHHPTTQPAPAGLHAALLLCRRQRAKTGPAILLKPCTRKPRCREPWMTVMYAGGSEAAARLPVRHSWRVSRGRRAREVTGRGATEE